MKVLMIGVDKSTGGGMWTVAENYISDEEFSRGVGLTYIPTSISGTVGARLWFTAKAYVRILLQFIRVRYDIAHIHMSERGSVFRKSIAVLLAKMFRCKVILHLHGAEFEEWYKKMPSVIRRYVQFIFRISDNIIILGEYWEKFITSISAGKTEVKVVYNAVRLPETNLYNADAVNLLFLGAAIERKGIHDLLRAIKMIDGKLNSDVKLLICGPDPENKIENRIRESGLEGRAVYKGFLDANGKREVFRQTMVNILPSWHEGMPMTILETMAEGIPNIATDVAAVSEAVNTENGALVHAGNVEEIAEQILRLVQDRELRIRKSQNAYDTVKEKFSLEVHLKKIRNIYESLI